MKVGDSLTINRSDENFQPILVLFHHYCGLEAANRIYSSSEGAELVLRARNRWKDAMLRFEKDLDKFLYVTALQDALENVLGMDAHPLEAARIKIFITDKK